jgi:hypothetical protein
MIALQEMNWVTIPLRSQDQEKNCWQFDWDSRHQRIRAAACRGERAFQGYPPPDLLNTSAGTSSLWPTSHDPTTAQTMTAQRLRVGVDCCSSLATLPFLHRVLRGPSRNCENSVSEPIVGIVVAGLCIENGTSPSDSSEKSLVIPIRIIRIATTDNGVPSARAPQLPTAKIKREAHDRDGYHEHDDEDPCSFPPILMA